MGGAEALARLVDDELEQPVPEAVSRLAEAIRSRTGPGTAAILFYGSCLRKLSSEGVLDFYVLVDAYRDANPGRRLALANALLPPNVFYLELDGDAGPLRAKYAVVSLADFARGAAGRWLRTRHLGPLLPAGPRGLPARRGGQARGGGGLRRGGAHPGRARAAAAPGRGGTRP